MFISDSNAQFEIVTANGKRGAFDTPEKLDNFYQRMRVPVGTGKKKRRKKKRRDIGNSEPRYSRDYLAKLKKCKPTPLHPTLVRRKPGNQELLMKLGLPGCVNVSK